MKKDAIVLLPLPASLDWIAGHLATRVEKVTIPGRGAGLMLKEDDPFLQCLTAQMVGYLEGKFLYRRSHDVGQVAALALDNADAFRGVMDHVFEKFFKGQQPRAAARRIARASYHTGYMDAVTQLQQTFSELYITQSKK